jgi:protein-tyrosine kinase
MSWFYEALLRAQKQRHDSTLDSRVGMSGQAGKSLIAMPEPVSPVAAASPSEPGMSSSATLSTVETFSPVLPHRDTQCLKGASRNGFRRLPLSLSEDSRLVFHTDPRGLPAEQFRLLRRTLRQEFPTGAVLMITSPGAGDGKTLTSLNLCASLGDLGDATIFVEADVRRPTAQNFLGSTVEPPGIEDAWTGRVEPRKTVHLVEELSFCVSLVAKIPEDPSHVVCGPGVKQFLAWAREHFRWVVIDAPPALPAADVAELLPFADAVLLVIRAESTSRMLSKRAFEMLGKRLYGVILNAATVDSTSYYAYLSQHYQVADTKQS